MTIASIFLSGLGWLRDIAAAVLRWLLSDFRHIIITLLAGCALVMFFRIDALAESNAKLTENRDAWKRAAGLWRQAHGQLLADVQRAQAEAESADRARAQRIEREQQQIIERTAHDYQNRIRSSAAAIDRLQRQLELATAADIDRGFGQDADLPRAYTARCRAFGAADCDQFFAALPATLKAAQDNTDQLVSLQDYVRGQLAIGWTEPVDPPE